MAAMKAAVFGCGWEAGAHALLVGEAQVTADDPGAKLRELL